MNLVRYAERNNKANLKEILIKHGCPKAPMKPQKPEKPDKGPPGRKL